MTDHTTVSTFPANGVAVVVGATGGIGAALAEQLRAHGTFERVISVGRSTDPAIDLTDEPGLEAAAQAVAGNADLRLVIVATGLLHGDGVDPEKSWRDLSAATLARAFAVNATGPALLMKHLLPRLPRTGKSVFAVLSARVGSIEDNRLGGWHAYRASKAALNQLVRTCAVELRRTRPDAICVSLHPGTVDTVLSAPFAKQGLDLQTPREAAARLLAVIDALEPRQSGGFFDQFGRAIPF